MKLPPLNAVRAFEAAGREGNFSRAAAELGVTPGAVSRQIKKLEDYLGANLFDRTDQEMRLTRQGQRFLESVRESLLRLEAAARNFDVQADDQPLHIWGSRFFIRLWLLPRMPDFVRAFPDQKVNITAAAPTDPPPSEFDLAIRMSDGDWEPLTSELLVQRELIPVCSPSYLARAAALSAPQDLAHHQLLETPGGFADWAAWYEVTGAPPVELSQRITLTSTDLAYSAALDGLGVLLGRKGFIESDIEKGHLVVPFNISRDMGDGFYLFYRKRRPLPKRIKIFKSWLATQLKH